MSAYIQVEFKGISQEQNDLLIAHLSGFGYHGFEEKETSLFAFIIKKDFNQIIVDQLANQSGVQFAISTIQETNWNQIWETSFNPVIIGKFCAIRATFHPPVTAIEHEIIITPKMSFGTGHHATTSMMIRQMEHVNFSGKTVLDFGTGTGVLAILSEKLGASKIVAIDQDDLSIENAKENIISNNCSKIDLRKGNEPAGIQKFDIILANIDKKVIVRYLPDMVNLLKRPGVLLLSGLLIEDQLELLTLAFQHQLIMNKKTDDNGWISIKFCL